MSTRTFAFALCFIHERIAQISVARSFGRNVNQDRTLEFVASKGVLFARVFSGKERKKKKLYLVDCLLKRRRSRSESETSRSRRRVGYRSFRVSISSSGTCSSHRALFPIGTISRQFAQLSA